MARKWHLVQQKSGFDWPSVTTQPGTFDLMLDIYTTGARTRPGTTAARTGREEELGVWEQSARGQGMLVRNPIEITPSGNRNTYMFEILKSE